MLQGAFTPEEQEAPAAVANVMITGPIFLPAEMVEAGRIAVELPTEHLIRSKNVLVDQAKEIGL